MAPKKGGTKAKASKGAGSSAAAGKRQKTAAGKLPSGSAAAVLAPTITDVLVADHRDTVALLRHFKEVAASGDALMMEKLIDGIAVTIRLHSQAEFDVLYPWVEKNLGKKGQEVAQVQHSREVHLKIESDLLQALQKRKEGGQALDGLLAQVTADFEAHLHEEEDEVMPLVLDKAGEEELANLAEQFIEAKARAPLSPEAALQQAKGGQAEDPAGVEGEEEEEEDDEEVGEEEGGAEEEAEAGEEE